MAKKKIVGTAKADKLTVNESNITLNAGKGNDIITIKKGKDSVIHGDAGNDTIYINGGSSNRIFGDAGKDTFVISQKSKAIIKDYTTGSDTLKVSGTITKTALSKKNMIISVGKGVVTLENAAGKVVSVKDGRGSYTMSKSAIVLGKEFTGTMSAVNFLSTITKIDGRKATKKANITGNAKANTIFAGKAGGTIKGGKGNDTIYAGTGKDTFIYATGNGKDVIKDYIEAQDTLKISGGTISRTELSGKDVVFTVGKGTVTLANASGKAISLKDSRGSYTVSKTGIKLGSDFSGTMDASKYLASVKTIDGRNAAKAVTVFGNAKDNIIYVGKNGGTYRGGTGSDKYVVSSAIGNSTLISIDQSNYKSGDADILQFTKINKTDVNYALSGSTLSIVHKNGGGQVKVTGWNDNPFKNIQFAGGSSITSAEINKSLASDKVIKISKSGTYQAGSGTDTFLFDGKSKGWDATIVGANSKDLLDLSEYKNILDPARGGHLFRLDEIYKTGNDLKMTFYREDLGEPSPDNKYESNEELVGTVTVKDYFKVNDKISRIKLYPSFWEWRDSVTSDSEEIETNRFIIGGEDNVNFTGSNGKDYIVTGSGNKTINAGDGDDYIVVGWHSYDHTTYGTQTVYGGDGDDWFIVPENGNRAFSKGELKLYGGNGFNAFSVYNKNAKNITMYGGDDGNSFNLDGSGLTAIGGSAIDNFDVLGTNHVLECGTNDNICIRESLAGRSLTINQHYYGSGGPEALYFMDDEIEDLKFDVAGDVLSIKHISSGVADGELRINNWDANWLSIIVGNPSFTYNDPRLTFGKNVTVYKCIEQ